MPRFLTTREAGDLLNAPEWRIRKIVDALDEPVERFGHKRMITAEHLPRIAEVLRESQRPAERGEVTAL